MLSIPERLYWLGFSVFPGIGPLRFRLLLKHFGSAKQAWNARDKDIALVIGQTLGARFDLFKNKFSFADYEKKLKNKGVSFLILSDNNYPKLLSEISNPPLVLYVKGEMKVFDYPAVAIVGTRKITEYGREVTGLFSQELMQAGCSIVSGLAFGVDAVAHKTAIERAGKTIAVLGCGVDCCYPRENQSLYNSIFEKKGVIVSEFPLGYAPSRGTFPSRNRVIAGLSQAVLVTEGAEDSGALITADYAFKFNRLVFAVPGLITSSLSKGPLKLIQKGAKLAVSAEDIVQELGIKNSELKSERKKIKGETEEENMILKLLENEPLHFDELVRRTSLDSSKIGSTLSLMELKGFVKNNQQGMFSLNL